MIHVQIASDITASGIEGVRWVLLEPSEQPLPMAAVPSAPAPAPPAAAQPEAPAPAPAPEPASASASASDSALGIVLAPAGAMMRLPMAALPRSARTGLRTQAWQLGISGLGLAAVMGLAQRELGPAALPWQSVAAAPAPTVQVALPSALVRPAPVAAATAPAAPVADSVAASAVPLAPSESREPATQPVPVSLVPALPAAASSTSPRERLITSGF